MSHWSRSCRTSALIRTSCACTSLIYNLGVGVPAAIPQIRNWDQQTSRPSMCTAATLTTPGHAAWLLSLVLATWVLAGTCSWEEPSSDRMAGGPGRTANRSRHTNWSCSPGLRPQQECPCNPCTNENICTYDCKAAWHQKSQRASFEGDIHPGPRSVPGLLLPHKAPVLVTPPELLQEQHAIWGVINKPSTVHETVISARTGCVAARPSLCQLGRAAIQSQ